MKQETSQWGKAVKKAVIDHDMTLKQLAEKSVTAMLLFPR